MTDLSSRPTLQAVMPLALEGNRDGQDLLRAVIQGRTLRHFFRRDQRLRLNVVGRSHELQRIAEALKPLETPWLQYRILDETAVHPEMTRSPMPGWYKQQVVKMAAPEWLGAANWLTLDADVICAKPVGIDDLLPGGRGLLALDEVMATPIYAQWAWATRELLGMVASPLAISTGITPLIYAAPIMRACHQAIEAVHGRPWKEVLLDAGIVADHVARYGHSWAENQIYHAIGVRTGLLRSCHALSGIDAPQCLIANGVWRSDDWPKWDPAYAFDRERPGFFAVCSSYTGMPAEFVAAKVEPYLQQPAPEPLPPPSRWWLLDEKAEHAANDGRLRVRILSRRPVVIHGPLDGGAYGLANVLSKQVLEPLRQFPAVVLVSLPTSHEGVADGKFLAARIARRQREAPLHRFVVLCNTEVETENFRQLGLSAVLVSHNALIDERPFLGDAAAAPEFDAVYNAGFHPAKRHQLAAQIGSLALIHANWHDRPEYAEYAAEARRALAHAADLNLDPSDDSYAFIHRPELGAQLQRARVGLCLSEVEGSLRASVEYLFAGLPLVSTFGRGGRDQLFDSDFCAVVPPDPHLIAAAVRELAARDLPRQYIRFRTMHKLAPHRERLVQVVQQAMASIGFGGRPDIAWPWFGMERTLTIADFHRELRGA